MSLAPSLKLKKKREQFLLRLTLFYPTIKIFQFLRLSTKFLAVLRLSVNPIETLIKRQFIEVLGVRLINVQYSVGVKSLVSLFTIWG